jgi:hypothetical protein
MLNGYVIGDSRANGSFYMFSFLKDFQAKSLRKGYKKATIPSSDGIPPEIIHQPELKPYYTF